MIRIRQIKITKDKNNMEHLKKKIASILNIKVDDILKIDIKKNSVDSRKKDICIVYEVDVLLSNEEEILNKKGSKDIFKTPIEEYSYKPSGKLNLKYRPIVVGSGPCGLFCAYMLSLYHYNPIVIERGEEVDNRLKSVEDFWKTGILNTNSNVQFGEGGAGTFSDGKLNTLVKDNLYRGKKAFEIFIEAGADKNIMYTNKPHLGTDKLCEIVKNIRKKIINNGGTFRFNTCLTNIKTNNNKLESIILNNNEEIKCDTLVLAIGHSARDTFKMLYDNKIIMEPKPFAIGVRISHLQEMINKAQYKDDYKDLPSASYKLTHTCSNKRGVYTFCMCPGGYVVNSSSEKERLAINGMSYSKRDSLNANSAVIVTIDSNDFGTNPLDGIEYQRRLEEKAYQLGKGKIPVQLFGDYLNNKASTNFGTVSPMFKGDYTFANLNEIFPDYINNSLKEGIKAFDNKIKGFASNDALLAAIESRTSSPVRIVRNDEGISSIEGIYPAGEGAGYAGGITSAAMDGIRVFEHISSKYSNKGNI